MNTSLPNLDVLSAARETPTPQITPETSRPASSRNGTTVSARPDYDDSSSDSDDDSEKEEADQVQAKAEDPAVVQAQRERERARVLEAAGLVLQSAPTGPRRRPPPPRPRPVSVPTNASTVSNNVREPPASANSHPNWGLQTPEAEVDVEYTADDAYAKWERLQRETALESPALGSRPPSTPLPLQEEFGSAASTGLSPSFSASGKVSIGDHHH